MSGDGGARESHSAAGIPTPEPAISLMGLADMVSGLATIRSVGGLAGHTPHPDDPGLPWWLRWGRRPPPPPPPWWKEEIAQVGHDVLTGLGVLDAARFVFDPDASAALGRVGAELVARRAQQLGELWAEVPMLSALARSEVPSAPMAI